MDTRLTRLAVSNVTSLNNFFFLAKLARINGCCGRVGKDIVATVLMQLSFLLILTRFKFSVILITFKEKWKIRMKRWTRIGSALDGCGKS